AARSGPGGCRGRQGRGGGRAVLLQLTRTRRREDARGGRGPRGRGPTGSRRRRLGTRGAEHGPQPPQVADGLLVHALLHRAEEREALLLVLDERVALTVPAQADAFLQVVEGVEVILPLAVDDLEHH